MSLLENILSPSVPDSKILYHYTTQEGLLGIIESSKLWTSSILHLNDAAEFNYTLRLLRDSLKRKLKEKKAVYGEFYAELTEGLSKLERMTIFVGSFSERGDSLGQWRAYTGHGAGFSIGFEYGYLNGCAENQAYVLRRCNYDAMQHNAVIEELIDGACGLVVGDNTLMGSLFLYNNLLKIAPVLKHPSFEDEREWRLISESIAEYKNDVAFGSGKSMLVPYRQFDLKNENEKMLVADLYIGPTPHMDLSDFSVRRLLNVAGITATVAQSRVPYRSW